MTESCKRVRGKERLTKLRVVSEAYFEKAAFVPVFIGRQTFNRQAWCVGEGTKIFQVEEQFEQGVVLAECRT